MNKLKMEYEPEFVEFANSHFLQNLIRGCIGTSIEFVPDLESEISDAEYYSGCDFGKLQDYSVISVLRREGDTLRLFFCMNSKSGRHTSK